MKHRLVRFRPLPTLLAGVALGGVVALVAAPQQSAPVRRAAELLAPGQAWAHLPAVDLADVAERTVRSVVNISTTKTMKMSPHEGMSPFFNDPFFRRFFELPPGENIPRERRARSLGSGVIVSADGVVLTNEHVIQDADEIRVTLSDGREYDAEVVGTDPKSDVAVLRLEEDAVDLEPLPLGSSADLRLGETVLAIGNPFGVGQTVTMGIVSALGRANVGIVDYEDFIQTDAAINPGNSGGALLNLKGELVGINTAIVSRTGGYQGIGFAIPSDMARAIMDSLLEHGKVLRGWLGVVIQDVDSDMAEALELDTPGGVLVADVAEDSPAEKAGVKRGDVIVAVDKQEVTTTGQLRNLIAGRSAGTKVRLGVLRDGARKNVKVVLGELPEELAGMTSRGEDAPSESLAGLELAGLSDELRARFEIPETVESGVVVVDVAFGSAAAEAGLRPGDVILEVDREKVESVKAFTRRLRKGEDARRLLLVWRGGGTSFVVLKLEESETRKKKEGGGDR